MAPRPLLADTASPTPRRRVNASGKPVPLMPYGVYERRSKENGWYSPSTPSTASR